MKEQIFQKIQKTLFLLNKIFWTNGFTERSFSEKNQRNGWKLTIMNFLTIKKRMKRVVYKWWMNEMNKKRIAPISKDSQCLGCVKLH